MSLGKAKTRIKAGVSDLQSIQGLKRTAVHFGVGYAIGTLVDLILEYIFTQWVNVVFKDEQGMPPCLVGFGIYPDEVLNGVPYMHYDDLFLLIVTVFMVFTKKLWFTVGFGLGWYISGYMNLYSALGLPPTPEPTP